LKFDHIAPLPHDRFGKVPANLVRQLNDLSTRRRAENDKFRKRELAIQKIIERKARHAISLNEAKFRAETVLEDENKDEAKPKTKEARKRHAEHPAWESNFYNDEVMSIVGDYLSLGSKVVASTPKPTELLKN
jgi:carboxyl-terminal processing protease